MGWNLGIRLWEGSLDMREEPGNETMRGAWEWDYERGAWE